jgi:hypothetical protein
MRMEKTRFSPEKREEKDEKGIKKRRIVIV